MRFFVGVIVGVLAVFVVAGAVIGAGAIDMSATRPSGALERLVGGTLADRSTEVRAPSGPNPLRPTPEVLRDGLEHYREDCLLCHGAPGVPRGELAKGMNPPPPDLWRRDTQEASDGELFWVIGHGIRMTGMPGWLTTHSEQDIWKLVAFVRHLPSLTVQERAALAHASQEGEPGDHGASHRPEHGDE